MPVLHPVWLPYTIDHLRAHVAGDDDERLTPYLHGAAWHREFDRRYPDRRGLALRILHAQCGIEADPRFWTANALLSLFYRGEPAPHLGALLARAFGSGDWASAIGANPRLLLDVPLPSPSRPLDRSEHPVPFVREAAPEPEPPLVLEAAVLGEGGFAVLIVARVLEDVRAGTAFEPTRNDLVRAVDGLLSPAGPLADRSPDRTSLLVLAPRRLLAPTARLYSALLERWRRDPTTLASLLPHREGVDWAALATRLGAASWEDCDAILPGALPWLRST